MSATRQHGQTGDAEGGGEAVILCVWRAQLDPARLEEYRRFEQEQCLPMLRKQPGHLGVLFLRQAEDHAASLTVWEDAGAVEALQSSPSYRQITHELAQSALLAGDESVEVLEVEGGDLRPEALVRALDRASRAGP
jgi:heme-degrading monooxygenase HmoA